MRHEFDFYETPDPLTEWLFSERCWTVWDKRAVLEQRIIYAPDSVIDALDAYTPSYRDRMDALMAKRAA